MKNKEPICRICGRHAYEIDEYIHQAEYDETTPEAIAMSDGTYNSKVNKFTCTSCYVKQGMPLRETIFKQDELEN